ncbi:MAG: hypothetical protein HUJ68_09945 [Clostridia bacterium]|nr:hypothetical protein [Clostridia bacterium]
MGTTNYCIVHSLRGKTPSGKAWKTAEGRFLAVSQCIAVHFPENAKENKRLFFVNGTNALLAPWWMCKDSDWEQHSLEDWTNIYGMDGEWINDTPDEFSERANRYDYDEFCRRMARLRQRKAAKRARIRNSYSSY